MPIVGHHSWDLYADAGDENIEGTFIVFMAPASITAQASLHKVSGDGVHKIGIRGFRHLPKAGGPEKQVNFTTRYWNWPGTIGHANVTSVTFAVFASADNELEGHADVYWWS